MEAYEGKEKYIFVSYAHKDSEKMLWFVEELQKYCNVWYDNGIHPGNEWADKIADKLENCSLFLCLVSPYSLASDNCRDELAMARDSGKPFINIRLSDVSFEGGMQLRYGRYQYFDLFNYDDITQAVKHLLKSESFDDNIFSKQDVLKKWVDHTKLIMAQTEETSSNLNENNADYFVKFRNVGGIVEFGRYLDTPIQWEIRRVQKDRAVLISKEILETMAFDEYTDCYAKSAIRAWLNTAFLENAFDQEEQVLLCPVSSEDEECKKDKVSLLSRQQAETFFKDAQDRMKGGNDYTRKNGLIANATGHGWWWLSSADSRAEGCVYRVYSNGRIGFDSDLQNEKIGVVPMIVVKIG